MTQVCIVRITNLPPPLSLKIVETDSQGAKMTGSFVLLGVIQILFLMIYRWVGKRYIFAPRFDHPAIFWNRYIAVILCIIAEAGVPATAIAAFFFTESPWLFLGLSAVGFVLFSIGINTQSR